MDVSLSVEEYRPSQISDFGFLALQLDRRPPLDPIAVFEGPVIRSWAKHNF